MEDVSRFVRGISTHSSERIPIYTYWYGARENTVDGFIEGINDLAEIYRRDSGIRLRAVLADIDKADLMTIKPDTAIIRIACAFAEYYLYQGYLAGLVIYDLLSGLFKSIKHTISSNATPVRL